MNEPDVRPFATVVQEPGDQQIRVSSTVSAEIGGDIESMALIRDVHALEEGQLLRGQPARQALALARGHAGPNVTDRPPDLAGPPARH